MSQDEILFDNTTKYYKIYLFTIAYYKVNE